MHVTRSLQKEVMTYIQLHTITLFHTETTTISFQFHVPWDVGFWVYPCTPTMYTCIFVLRQLLSKSPFCCGSSAATASSFPYYENVSDRRLPKKSDISRHTSIQNHDYILRMEWPLTLAELTLIYRPCYYSQRKADGKNVNPRVRKFWVSTMADFHWINRNRIKSDSLCRGQESEITASSARNARRR